MLIWVLYRSGKHDMVNEGYFNGQLEVGEIAKFRRRSGWVTVGVDPMRGDGGHAYDGLDRRGLDRYPLMTTFSQHLLQSPGA